MEARTLTRPAATLASLLRQQPTTTTVPRRGHKTFSRTKRALNIPPHPNFLPSTPAAGDTIIYNPPSAAPSVYHTPFKFLPATDPRRRANLSTLFASSQPSSSNSTAATSSPLPPALNVPSRGATPRYHLSKDDVAEIRKLRAQDPDFWSVSALARKFDCSETFITICTPAPREHTERLARKLEAIKGRWGGIRTKAREDRSRRKEMLFRGEL
ncbi:mitochondrial ribosomal protein subunit L20-domain-containing protein [Colletotrichum godetiae]|uniref:Mitochondrial ribosomal protein subunit L20-domain-containing protein n=1 Tax=Colletotrichum godetiae TaxID=1209918 RepID=A0AAJ0AYD8_9PEZI|nr:mitochondrial ribosomal protein subunit L20-domain-containing protein [Colletotrichum godetiae]KAK1700600.1 mitochondrial ribosomal protein subunit L20-domain-containing protein [Colletotrichum godetiae]